MTPKSVRAAIRYTLADGAKTGDESFKMISWWTRETIDEAFYEMTVGGELVVVRRGKDGERAYAIR